jgi:hypothetical protein
LEPEHGEAKTLKEQIDQHKSNKTCYACHKSIDPYGFALESFDASGEWRERYKIKQAHRSTFQYSPKGYFKIGAPVDASGEMGADKFENIFGLKRVLVSNEWKIAYNFAKKFFEYARGEKPNLEQRLYLWDFLGKAEENVRLKNIVTEVLIKTLNESKE